MNSLHSKRNKSALKLFLLLVLSLSFLFSSSQNSFSQNKKIQKEKQPVSVIKDNSMFSNTPANNLSQQELDLNNQMNQLKLENNSTNGKKILELQNKIETLNGAMVSKEESNQLMTLIPAGKNISNEKDNVSLSQVVYSATAYITGIATQVEQRGTGAGKIWVAIGLGNLDTGVAATPDTLLLYYSNNNGASYNFYAKFAFGGTNKFEFDNIDMEIIENSTGTKYLHIVFEYITNAYTGQRLVGYMVVTAPALSYSATTLAFPGYSVTSKYLHPRITSDNAIYLGNSYVDIVLTQDSVAGLNHFYMPKFCRVLNPYTIAPAITYFPKSIYTPVAAPYEDIYNLVQTDIAYYNNSNDSLIFLLSGYPGFTDKLYFYKAFANSFVYPVFAGVVTPSGNNLASAKIAANGGSNQKKLMVTYTDDYLNSGDLDQWILTSGDATNWFSTVLDYTSNNKSKYGDVIGRRNANGSFAVNFINTYGHLDNISSYNFTDLNLSSSIHSLNTNYANSICAPKPAFRYVNGDSCLSIWSSYFTVNSTGGCSASNLYLITAFEGYYNDVNDVHSIDLSVNVLLADALPPYSIVDTGYAVLGSDNLSNVFAFSTAPIGNYYLVVKHYNTLETWSATTVYIDQTTPAYYDFTSSDAQAYGNNMVLKGARWCIYSGDVNQDGTIDATDLSQIDNDVVISVMGNLLITDLNGDYIVDGSDLSIADINVLNSITVVTP